jgi:hypothetical protein
VDDSVESWQNARGFEEALVGHRSGKFALALLTMGATLGGAAVASAQVYPPTSCSLAVDAVVAVPGESVVAATAGCDNGFAAGAMVTFTLQIGQDGGNGGGNSGGNGGGNSNSGGNGRGNGNGGGGNSDRPEPSGRVVGTATADAEGNVSTPIPIPADASPGAYVIAASGAGADGSTVTFTANLTAAVGDERASDAAATNGRTRRSGGSVEPAAAAEELLPSESFTPLWLVAPAFVLLTLSTSGVLALRRRAVVRARG